MLWLRLAALAFTAAGLLGPHRRDIGWTRARGQGDDHLLAAGQRHGVGGQVVRGVPASKYSPRWTYTDVPGQRVSKDTAFLRTWNAS